MGGSKEPPGNHYADNSVSNRARMSFKSFPFSGIS